MRSGEFREEVAYSAARDLFLEPVRPTALYVANGVMALGVMRAMGWGCAVRRTFPSPRPIIFREFAA